MPGPRGVREGEPLDPVEVLRDTLARIDAVLASIEGQALDGDTRAGALYCRLMAQRAEIALKIRELERGADRLLEWLVGLLKA